MLAGVRLSMKYELIVFDMDGTLTFDALDFDTLCKELGLLVRRPILDEFLNAPTMAEATKR